MAKAFAKTFRATLEPSGMGLQSTFAILPFAIEKAWPGLRVRRVMGEINGFAFRTALFPTARGHGFLVNKKMLAGAGARQGDRVEIRLEPDLEERKEIIPDELLRAMKGAPGLRKWFEKLPPGHQRWIAQTIAEPKSAASRQKRAEDTAERLYLTMEGERETPPILRAAFQRQPLAEAGWKALTPIQRRNYLFGIFSCRSVETREKRVRQAIELALTRVRRDTNAENPAAPRKTRKEQAARQDWAWEDPGDWECKDL
jgi:uncharacterized protein YdeI (YjbR/CyaY-like superfamily)